MYMRTMRNLYFLFTFSIYFLLIQSQHVQTKTEPGLPPVKSFLLNELKQCVESTTLTSTQDEKRYENIYCESLEDFSPHADFTSLLKILTPKSIIGHGLTKQVERVSICETEFALARRLCDVDLDPELELHACGKHYRNESYAYFDAAVETMLQLQYSPKHFPVILSLCYAPKETRPDVFQGKYIGFIAKLEHSTTLDLFNPDSSQYEFLENKNSYSDFNYGKENGDSEGDLDQIRDFSFSHLKEQWLMFSIRLEVAINYAHALAELHNQLVLQEPSDPLALLRQQVVEELVEIGVFKREEIREETLHHQPNFRNHVYIHCDHKPSNLAVTDDLEVKVLDTDLIRCVDCGVVELCDRPAGLDGLLDTSFDIQNWGRVSDRYLFLEDPPKFKPYTDTIFHYLKATNHKGLTAIEIYAMLKNIQKKFGLKVQKKSILEANSLKEEL